MSASPTITPINLKTVFVWADGTWCYPKDISESEFEHDCFYVMEVRPLADAEEIMMLALDLVS